MDLIRNVNLGPKDITHTNNKIKGTYYKQISKESLEVLHRYGPEAPARLNHYHLALEQALIDQAQRCVEMAEELNALKGETQQPIDITTQLEHLKKQLLDP